MKIKSKIALSLITLLMAGAASAAENKIEAKVDSKNELKTFNVTIKDHKFEPATIEIPADTKIKLLVKNADATPEEFESHAFNIEKIIPAGAEVAINIKAQKAGVYKFVGEFHEKTAKGEIVVK